MGQIKPPASSLQRWRCVLTTWLWLKASCVEMEIGRVFTDILDGYLSAKVRLAIAHPFSRSVGRADAKRGERASSNKAKRSVPSRQLECQAMDCDCRAASQAP